MKCQKCNEREANTHYTQIVNGKKEEYYLCDKCAAESPEIAKMQNSFASPFDMGFESFLTGIFGEAVPGRSISGPAACPQCGMSLRDFTSGGKLGCSACYETFRDSLNAPLKQIHGSVRHSGKIPSRIGGKLKTDRKIKDLEVKLSQAVLEQRFEEAAKLRDEIKALKTE